MNSSNEEYGTERFKKYISNSSGTIQSILSDVYSFTAGQEQSDDITIVMIEGTQQTV